MHGKLVYIYAHMWRVTSGSFHAMHAWTYLKTRGVVWGWGSRPWGGRRRSLSTRSGKLTQTLTGFMFGLAFLIWMASTDLFSQNPSALLQTVALSQLMRWKMPQSKEGLLILCLFGKYCMPLQFTLANQSPVTYFSQSQTMHNHVAPLVSVCYNIYL